MHTGLAFLLLQLEDPDGAVREVQLALAMASDAAALGAAQSQYAVILMRLGLYSEAIRQTERALANLRSSESATQIARLRSNRGIVWAYLGDFDRAETELNLALELHRRQGSELSAAQVVHNLGFVAGRRGDVPAALRYFDDATAAYDRLELPAHSPDIDRCEVLLSAHLLPEAREAAEQAVSGLERAGLGVDLAEGRLMLAQVALAERDEHTALGQAELAAAAFDRQRRAGWAALARYTAARARWMNHHHPGVVETEGVSLAEELSTSGWRLQALEARIAAARAALDRGDTAAAREILQERPQPGRRSSADERVRGWYAEALGRLATGQRSGALRALQSGLKVADEHRVALGATELRARAAIEAADLAELGLDLALEQGEPASVLAWAERWRARSLWRPAAVPPANPDLARLLSDLRHVVAGLERAAPAGGVTDALEHQRAKIESEIRQLSLRETRTSAGSELPPPPSVRNLRVAIGDGLLVELVSRNGSIYAITCGGDAGCRLHQLCTAEELEHQQAALQFALGRLAYRRSAPASLEVAAHLLGRATAAVDRLLFGRLEPLLGDARDGRSVVLVPTGELHTIPWGFLPSLEGRPLSVVPSAALWLARQPEPQQAGEACSPGNQDRGDHSAPAADPPDRVVVVAGPGVATAPQEAAELRSLYPHATVLEGTGATVRNVATALEGAGLAHIAAHGRFRSDNALFSALELSDGPLTVYDLESISRPPAVMVLSACDAGRSQVHPGDELMGTTAALLSIGTATIVASVAPVPDSGAPPVMARLHARLCRGDQPAAALAGAQQEIRLAELAEEELAAGSERALEALAAAAFVCFGAGGGPARPWPPSRNGKLRA